MADGKYPGLPLEQRIGSISDGEVTNFGPLIRSTRLTVQPTRKSDTEIERLRAVIAAVDRMDMRIVDLAFKEVEAHHAR